MDPDFRQQLQKEGADRRAAGSIAIEEMRKLVAEKALEIAELKRMSNVLAARFGLDVPFPEPVPVVFPPGAR